MSITSSNQESDSGSGDSNSNSGGSDNEIPLAVATVCLPEDDCVDLAELEMGGVLAESDVSNRSTTAHASSSNADDGDIPIAVATPRNTTIATNTANATRTPNNNNTGSNRPECSSWKRNLLFCVFCAFVFLVLPYFVYRVSGAAEGSTDDNVDMPWKNVTTSNGTEAEEDAPPTRRPIAPFALP